jgi:hypothetical protein
VNSLENVSLSLEVDRFEWKPNPVEGFLVKSAYDLLFGGRDGVSMSGFELGIFSRIWESPAPSKVIIFEIPVTSYRCAA